jgi:autotransporter-associated beta strand protein
MNRFAIFVGIALLGIITILSPVESRGDSPNWQISNGDWSSATNWSGNLLPTAGDWAYIVNGGTASISQPNATCGTLSVGSDAGSGAVQLSAGGLSVAGNEYIGFSGNGLFSQWGGMHSVSNVLALGQNTGGYGAYNLSDGSLSAVQEYAGYSGSASFTQSGGDHFISNVMFLGIRPGGSGTYDLSGSGLLSTNFEAIGDLGSGSFTQSGGTHAASFELIVGAESGGSGTYNLSGSSQLTVPKEFIGLGGSGSFSQSGGAHSVSNILYVGLLAGGSGGYNLTGGSLSAPKESIGDFGGGSIAQSGGTHSVSVELDLGSGSSGSGTYDLTGCGQLSVTNESIGISGSGRFTQSGGTHTIAGNLVLGVNPGSVGTYNLNGGLLSLAGLAQQGGAATFNFGGGTFQAGSPFESSVPIVLSTAASNAVFDTNGNTLTLAGPLSGPGGMQVVGSGLLVLAGSNRYSGATLVNAGMTIGSANALSLNSAVTVSGGILDVTTAGGTVSALTVGSNGILNLSIGNLLTSTGLAFLNGTLNLSGTYSGPSIELLAYVTHSGSFSSTPTLSNYLGYRLTYGTDGIYLTDSPSGPPTWLSIAGGNWSNAKNWSTGASPNAAGQTAVFNLPADEQVNVTVDGPKTVGTISITNSASTTSGYSLGGAGGLTLDNSGSESLIAVSGGSNSIDTRVTIFGSSLTISLSNSGSLAISGGINDDGSRSLLVSGDGSGQLVLSGSNTYGGGTAVVDGTLEILNSSALPDGSSLTVGAGAEALFSGAIAAAPVNYSAVPEPGTLQLLAVAAGLGIGLWQRRKHF